MRNVLAYVDERIESERAVELGIEIASRNRGSLKAVAVIEPLALAFDEAGLSCGEESLAKALLMANDERLREIASRLGRDSIRIAIETRIGATWIEVVRAAMSESSDLVIKTARGRTRRSWPLFSSTALHLLRKCPAPVWLVAPNGPLAPRRILAVVSPEPGNPARNSFEGEVLARAEELAGLFGAELDVLCCWHLASEDLLARHLEPRYLLRVIDGMRDEMHGALDALLAPFSGRIDERCVHLQKGTESAEALALVEARGSDLVVLGSIGPDAGPGMMISEEVENLVQRVSCSILAIKPAGFRSPIRLEDG